MEGRSLLEIVASLKRIEEGLNDVIWRTDREARAIRNSGARMPGWLPAAQGRSHQAQGAHCRSRLGGQRPRGRQRRPGSPRALSRLVGEGAVHSGAAAVPEVVA